jgi:hypothetical protein
MLLRSPSSLASSAVTVSAVQAPVPELAQHLRDDGGAAKVHLERLAVVEL